MFEELKHLRGRFLGIAVISIAAGLFGLLGCEKSNKAESTNVSRSESEVNSSSSVSTSVGARRADDEASPIFDVTIPAGYRDWRLISVAHEEGNLNSLGAILGNDIAIKAYREGKLPFPDGTIIAALHWRHASSKENNRIFGRTQSFVAGSPTNVQFMVKDSKKYASTGGWGFGHFNERDGKPADKALLQTCYPCHKANKERDLAFTRYAP